MNLSKYAEQLEEKRTIFYCKWKRWKDNTSSIFGVLKGKWLLCFIFYSIRYYMETMQLLF